MLKFIVPITLANAKEQYALNNRLMIYLLKTTVRLNFITSNRPFRACCCIMGNQDIDLIKWWTCSYKFFVLIVSKCLVLR